MRLDPDSCYRALLARDRRFDGKFFVGVASTRIYCRPVCAVRMPRRENCNFYASAAAAEVDGYRPCLRCRPELAPGNAGVDAVARLAQSAVSLIENGALDEGGIEGLAARIGVSGRHLRRVFEAEFGVAPIEYAQTQRLLLAKRLLTDTTLPVTEVALASGFASLRRFNALFKERYRMPPGRLRRSAAGAVRTGPLVFELSYRPPYDWDSMLAFLAARSIRGVEEVTGDAYWRTLAVTQHGRSHSGTIAVRRATRRAALAIEVSPSLARGLPAVLAKVKQAFDLSCDPTVVAAALGALAAERPGLRVPGAFDGFEMAVRAVVGQQITVRGARTLLGRFAAAFGATSDAVQGSGPARFFPSPSRIAACEAAEIACLGITAARARTLIALARAIGAGELLLQPDGDVEATVRALIALPGVGAWTAQYIAMRALGWPDAFLANDLVVRKAMGESSPARALVRSEAWRPWRAYAVLHLWRRTTP